MEIHHGIGHGRSLIQWCSIQPEIHRFDTLFRSHRDCFSLLPGQLPMPTIRTISRSHIVFPGVIVLTVILSLLPTSAVKWVGVPAELMGFVMAPGRLLGSWVGEALRPPPSQISDVADDPEMRDLQLEAETFAQLYRKAELRVQELQEQLEQLQRVPVEALNTPISLMSAAIISRNPNQLHGPMELRGGSLSGISTNSFAVYGGVHLIGRVINVSRFSCWLQPITGAKPGQAGYIRAAVFHQDQQASGSSGVHRVQLQPQDDGTFIGDAETIWALASGDLVVLDDPSWPGAAQGMIIGSITSIQVKDEAPLRQVIYVTPRYSAFQLHRVTLLNEDESTSGGADQ